MIRVFCHDHISEIYIFQYILLVCWEVYMFTKLECAQKQHGTSTRSGMDVHVYCLRPKSLSAQVATCILAWKFSTMTQAELMHAWLHAPENRLCAWEVAKALGLREASKEILGDKGRLPWIAARLTKVGGGCPTVQSLHVGSHSKA